MRWILCIVLVVGAMIPLSPSSEAKITGLSLWVDQDLFYPPANEDRNYTMGVFFDVHGSADPLKLGKALKWFDQHTGWNTTKLPDMTGDSYHTFHFGHESYTPDDLQATTPVTDDRPYSSIMWVSNSRLILDKAVDKDPTKAYYSELRIGLLGTDISEWVQTRIHIANRRFTGLPVPYDPKGWDHQISDGGELTLKLSRTFSQLVWHNREDKNRWLNYDLAYHAGVDLGYQTRGNFGIVGRIGPKLSSGFWRHRPLLSTQAKADQQDKAERDSYFFAAAQAIGVGYDVLLQGQFRDTSHTFHSNEIERLIAQFQIGYLHSFSDRFSFSYSFTGHTPEYRADEVRLHYWAGVTINYIF